MFHQAIVPILRSIINKSATIVANRTVALHASRLQNWCPEREFHKGNPGPLYSVFTGLISNEPY